MKKLIITIVCVVVCLSSCGTYTGQGAAVGSYTGSILGSAIGGIIGGPRGEDFGTVVGLIGGAAVGATVGAQADKAATERYQGDYQGNNQRDYAYNNSQGGYAGNEQNNYAQGDDRIYDYKDETYSGDYSAAQPHNYVPTDTLSRGTGFKLTSNIEIRNLRFVDDNKDNTISAGEESRVIFEIMNRSSLTLYDVQPCVVETTNNKHIFISPNVRIESIKPGMGVRYTAMVKADNRLKNGTAIFRVAVAQGNSSIMSNISELQIPTSGRK